MLVPISLVHVQQIFGFGPWNLCYYSFLVATDRVEAYHRWASTSYPEFSPLARYGPFSDQDAADHVWSIRILDRWRASSWFHWFRFEFVSHDYHVCLAYYQPYPYSAPACTYTLATGLQTVDHTLFFELGNDSCSPGDTANQRVRESEILGRRTPDVRRCDW